MTTLTDVFPVTDDELVEALMVYRMEKGEALEPRQAEALLREHDNNKEHYAWERGVEDGKEYESEYAFTNAFDLPRPEKPVSPYWNSTQVAQCGMPLG